MKKGSASLLIFCYFFICVTSINRERIADKSAVFALEQPKGKKDKKNIHKNFPLIVKETKTTPHLPSSSSSASSSFSSEKEKEEKEEASSAVRKRRRFLIRLLTAIKTKLAIHSKITEKYKRDNKKEN